MARDTRGRQRQSPGGRSAKSGKGKSGKRRGGMVLPSVANHPRAGQQVKRAKGWAGLFGFCLVAFVSWRGEVPVEDMLLRALAGGIVAYLVVWATAVAIWRHLVVTELAVVREKRAEEEAARRAAMPPPAPEQPAEV